MSSESDIFAGFKPPTRANHMCCHRTNVTGIVSVSCFLIHCSGVSFPNNIHVYPFLVGIGCLHHHQPNTITITKIFIKNQIRLDWLAVLQAPHQTRTQQGNRHHQCHHRHDHHHSVITNIFCFMSGSSRVYTTATPSQPAFVK